jgi:hypothetical protein
LFITDDSASLMTRNLSLHSIILHQHP